jgi:uncharacterized protein YndB with AHSA1/START domain
MPTQKDLKRIVRARMEKTGEAYTAARLHIVSKKEEKPKKTEPTLDYTLGGMTDAAVKKQTGRDWAEWVKTLDAQGAREKPHREIVAYVSSLGTPDWWSQMVTVGYERIRRLRDRGQRRGGLYEASKSRTFAVPVAKLFEAFSNARLRKRWLPPTVKLRSTNPGKAARLDFDDGTTVQVGFIDKGAKSAVAVQHEKLPDKAAIAKRKEWWSERFDQLAELLA